MRGVYVLKNLKNGKVFVGANKNVEERVRHQTSLLLTQSHSNEVLQDDWNRAGEEKFQAEFIEEVAPEESLMEAEQKWIDHFNATDPDHGYNLEGRLESQPQVVLSFEKAEEIRKAYGTPIIRESGRLRSPYGISMVHLANQYGVTGELISQILRNLVWKRPEDAPVPTDTPDR